MEIATSLGFGRTRLLWFWIQSYPAKNKNAFDTKRGLQQFMPPLGKNLKIIVTSDLLEFIRVCEDLSWNHGTETPSGSVDQNTPYHTLFVQRFHALRTGTHSCLNYFLRSTFFKWTQICQTQDDRAGCSTLPLKSFWCGFHIVHRYKHTFILLISDSCTQDIAHFISGGDMFNCVVQQIAHHVERQDFSAHDQGYSALHYQQEQFENAFQEHQRVACAQVDLAAALATSRTAAQMTSRFREIEHNVEAKISHQQRGYGPKLLPSQLRQVKLSDTICSKKLQQG